MKANDDLTGLEIAVIGMAARYPGITNLEGFWDVLRNGWETLTFYTDEELVNAGEEIELLDNPDYIRARGMLEDVEYFDASFFGYSQWEARLMDPQVRVFHQCAWHALEDAGYAPLANDKLIGVYAGAKSDFTWQLKALLSPDEGMVDLMTAILLSSKDHIGTRISYALDLRGPSFSFYTACSTSLVAIHLASQALLAGECDMALAGGVTFHLPQIKGYLYDEELIHSRDGHTRSFDAKSAGLVDGSGAGIVLLKRLEDAKAEKDHIYAVIKGTGINNDGSRKIGYTAPSILGQEALLTDVYNAAAVNPADISFIECHGSATSLGDQVEIEALRRFFPTESGNRIALGSVKTNFGHCDCAAGVASFIKTVLSLYHRQIPPTLHFTNPNPRHNLENSRFYIETGLIPWKNTNGPLRAGVNSLGLGGTNAHVILEEAPDTKEMESSVNDSNEGYYLLPLSAKTPKALGKLTENLAGYLTRNLEKKMGPVAYTLQEGRKALEWRRAFVVSDTREAITQLSQPESSPIQPILAGEQDRPLIFMYSGQGSEYIDMGRNLYEKEKTFQEDIDKAFDYLTRLIGEDLKPVLYPQDETQRNAAHDKIHHLYYTQPVKFIFEYAYTRLLIRKGIKPYALMGYSFGEYMVACVAGVISLEDALTVLMKRGDIMAKAPAGAMIGVALSETQLESLLKPGLYLGGINSPRMCLVSGEIDAIEDFEKELEKNRIDFFRYRAACGGHSPLMDPILPELAKELEKITFHKPQIPYVSGLTGTWITDEEAQDPYYFTRQLKSPVLFAHALETLFKNPGTLFLEVGPGTTLANYVNYYRDNGIQPETLALPMVRHHKDMVDDNHFLLNRLAQLWSYGKKINWETLYPKELPGRCSLPGYPFEKQYYWIDFDPLKGTAPGAGALFGSIPGKDRERPIQRKSIRDWYYIPSWKNTVQQRYSINLSESANQQFPRSSSPILVFMDGEGLGKAVINVLEENNHSVITVESIEKGESFRQTGNNGYLLDPGNEEHYNELLIHLKQTGVEPETILHLLTLDRGEHFQKDLERNETLLQNGYYSLLSLARALGRQDITTSVQLEIITSGMQCVAGEPLDAPIKAALLGPVKIIPQEYPNIKCRIMDVKWPQPGSLSEKILVGQLYNEIQTPQTQNQEIAFRGNQRLEKYYEPIPLDAVNTKNLPLKEGGVYLIVGGLGGVGIILARYLANVYKAKLILTSRTGLPPRNQWTTGHENSKKISVRQAKAIKAILEMEQEGAEVMVKAVDVSDETAMTEVLKQTRQQFGPINGVIHCGYVADGTVIDQRKYESCEAVLAPKINGTLLLDRLFKKLEPLDFFILCSSLAGIFGPIGQVAYTAGSAFQDAFAVFRNTHNPLAGQTISIDWGDWAGTESLEESVRHLAGRLGIDPQAQLKDAMKPEEGLDAFNRVVATNAPHVLVSARDISVLLGHLNRYAEAPMLQEHLVHPENTGERKLLPRPQLKTPYVAPVSKIEKAIAVIWQSLFSLESVGVDDDFFQLGGDSLKAMTTSSKILKELNIKIPIARFFSSPTVRELAQYIDLRFGDKKDIEEIQPVYSLVEKKEHYPLSAMQRRLYHLYKQNPQSTAYNVMLPFLIEGPLCREKLDSIIHQLVQRHDVFRTSYHLINDEPKQIIHRDVNIRMESRNISELEVEEFLETVVQPFNLENLPLLRVMLLSLIEEKHILVIETHHIAIDGTSFDLFTDEFFRLYREKALSPVKVRVIDYCQWQYQRFNRGEMKASEIYWLEQYREPVQALQIPPDYSLEIVPEDGRAVWCDIDERLTGAMRILAQQTGTTTFMVFLAAYAMVLHKWTQKTDLVIGLRTANRPHDDLQKVIGRFSNELGIRLRTKPNSTFNEFLVHVKEKALDLFKHQDYSFDQLIRKLNYTWPVKRASLFETMVVYNNMENQTTGVTVGDLKFGAYGLRRVRVLYDIFLQATEVGNTIHLLVHYPVSQFKQETIEGMLNNLLGILEQVTINPKLPLSL